ncbi:MAG: uncharacterized protein QOK31_1979 [Solirubrobacteraceae bacterium]|nr:uncharacterized protein [Solirubrobacteraceae bacterium]
MSATDSPGAPAPGTARETATATGPQTGWTPADPGPLGLGAFALTTFMLSCANAQIFGQGGAAPKNTVPIVLSLAFAFGGLAQLLAGMWEFRTGNTFGAVAFTSFGAFWLSFFALGQFGYLKELGADKTVEGHAVGLYLISWGIFTAYMFVASLRTTGAIALVFVLLAATFFFLGFGNYHASVDTVKIGGYVGVATAIAAWYASFAGVTNSTWGRVLLPVFPLKRD